MPPKRKSKPRSPDHAALGRAVEMLIAEDPELTQEIVALEGNLSPKQVSAIVRGQSNPTYVNLLKLARGLNVSLGELMSSVDELRGRHSTL